MLTYHLEVKGLDALQANFEKAPDIYEREVTGATNKSLVAIQATAKNLSPVDTGRLRSSIAINSARRQGDEIKGSVGTDVQYSIFQEVGTSRGVPARYYMRGAIEQKQETVNSYFAAAGRNLAEAIANGRSA